jgi:hypothetical protein
MPFYSFRKMPDNPRDFFAGHLADSLMTIFGASVFGAFLLLGGIIYGAYTQPKNIDNVIKILKDGFEVVRLTGALFSPLLAFVLGYYFNQSTKATAEAAGAAAGQAAGNEAGTAAGAAAGAKAGAAISGNAEQPILDIPKADPATSIAEAAGAVAGARAGTEAGAKAGAQAGTDVATGGDVDETDDADAEGNTKK